MAVHTRTVLGMSLSIYAFRFFASSGTCARVKAAPIIASMVIVFFIFVSVNGYFILLSYLSHVIVSFWSSRELGPTEMLNFPASQSYFKS